MDTAERPIVDLDANATFGKETIELLRPFRYKGAVYSAITIRVPTGLDVKKHVAANGRINDIGLMCDLAELSEDVFDAMYLGDRNRVDRAVGKHLSTSPATSTS